jgi:hypothetical protein
VHDSEKQLNIDLDDLQLSRQTESAGVEEGIF